MRASRVSAMRRVAAGLPDIMTPMASDPTMRVAPDVKLGKEVRLAPFINLYGCEIGDESRIGPFVEIQKGVRIGRRVKIQSHSFVCEGVHIDDEVFVGHGVMFINDRFPRATRDDGELKGDGDWKCEATHIGQRASIGSNATILCGVRIGAESMVGAGSVVTADVPPRAVVAGNPARIMHYLDER
jgi:UDP-2-acetamido-3-amino-2,3-dideoxy-glucuronate N-acetyltransferase